MDIRDRYRKTFNKYYNFRINDEEILRKIDQKCSSPGKRIRHRWAAIAIASVLLVIGSTYVAASAGLFQLSDIFRKNVNDPVSADLMDAGIAQELNIVGEHDDFTLKLVAFTGDMETHKVLFEMISRKDLGDYEVAIVGQTASPEEMERKDWNWVYGTYEALGTKVTSDDGEDVYYFSYELPPHWVKETNDDVLMRISKIRLYDRNITPKWPLMIGQQVDESQLVGEISCDLYYRFTPDRSMLQEPVIVAVNRSITKDIYHDFSFPIGCEGREVYKGGITAPKKTREVRIDSITFSNYKAEVNATIMDEDITSFDASRTWFQCIIPMFVTSRSRDGAEVVYLYETVLVENPERLRLYADGTEIPLLEESLHYLPGRGEDGHFKCSSRYKGFDYEKVQNIELRFGERVFVIK